VKIGLADPHGASLYSWYADGELKSEGTSISEGIGQGRITANLEGLAIDHPVPDQRRGDAGTGLRPGAARGPVPGRLDRHQRRRRGAHGQGHGPGHTIVTILCDHGSRYQSKLFNPAFLAEKGLPTPPWM
jgi:cysteine synthase A